MKLYYSPYTCAMAVHIALREAGLPFTLERVDLKTKTTASGANFLDVSPQGYVPALQLDDGTVLTEAAALLQYVADLAPESGLAPAGGTVARAQLNSMLNFIATEAHKGFSPLFSSRASDDYKDSVRATLGKRYAWLNSRLEAQPFLMGQHFTVADAYLFTVLGWTRIVNLDLSPYPALQAFQALVKERPAVRATLDVEKTKS